MNVMCGTCANSVGCEKKQTDLWLRFSCNDYLHVHYKKPINSFINDFNKLYLLAIDNCTDVRYEQHEKGLEILKNICLLAMGEYFQSLKLIDTQKMVFCQVKPSRWEYWDGYLMRVKDLLKDFNK